MIPKGFHPSVEARYARSHDLRLNQPYRGAFFSQVLAPLPNERVAIASPLGEKNTNFVYPFSSRNAWLRGQPETSTVMLSIIGGDSFDQQPVSYFDATKGAAAAEYARKVTELRSSPRKDIESIIPYRTLTPGDIDQGSNFAQVFLGLKDVYQARGGLSHFTMTSQEASVDTPLFQVHGPMYRIAPSLNDEVRFGVVRRVPKGDGSPGVPMLIRDSRVSPRPLAGLAFAKEFSVVLNSFGALGVGPSTENGVVGDYGWKLIDHRQGCVVEDNGDLARSVMDSNELRARFRWFTGVSETRAEIDQSGNFFVRASDDALTGGKIAVPNGNFVLDVGGGVVGAVPGRSSITARASSDVQLTAGGYFLASSSSGFRIYTQNNGEITADYGLTARANGVISIQSGTKIELGNRADRIAVPLPKYPVLIGNPLYLATLKGWISVEQGFDRVIGSYAAAASAAWSALGGLTALIDPSGTVPSLCLSAGAAATALSAVSPVVAEALSAHLPTLENNPGGFISMMTVSE